MKRKDFLQTLALLPFITKAMNLNELKNTLDALAPTEKMPVLFIGHGNPMNAIEDNPFTRSLAVMGKEVQPKPNAILVVSAHWLTKGTFVSTSSRPETIYDFGGFPDELFKVKYPAPGAPLVAAEVKKILPDIHEDNHWGLDHGAWTVLKHMYPEANIPVFQLSIDYSKPMQWHFDLAAKLKSLREKGVLILGSGNIVHNLRMWFAKEDNKPYDWATEFDEWVKDRLIHRDFQALVDYEKKGKAAQLSVPTMDHYVPMLYNIALADPKDELKFTYEETFSAASMRCFRIG